MRNKEARNIAKILSFGLGCDDSDGFSFLF
jgi:hypothetical protein